MVDGVNDGRRNDWHGCFTDSGWRLVRLYGVHVNLSRRIGNVRWCIAIEISLLDTTVLYSNGPSRHNLRKTETDFESELPLRYPGMDWLWTPFANCGVGSRQWIWSCSICFLLIRLKRSCPADWMLDLRPVSHRGIRTWHIGNLRRTEWSWQYPKVTH